MKTAKTLAILIAVASIFSLAASAQMQNPYAYVPPPCASCVAPYVPQIYVPPPVQPYVQPTFPTVTPVMPDMSSGYTGASRIMPPTFVPGIVVAPGIVAIPTRR